MATETVRTPDAPAAAGVRVGLIATIFFFSGFPALVYQLAWQRSLFSIYGVNIESVTIVVTAFMLGLGLGSLVGGAISQRSGLSLLLVFGAIEIGIALFGAFSLDVFAAVGTITLGMSYPATAIVSLALVVLPTMLMGATLPILVAYLVNLSGNVGRSVGMLYFVNTLGAACACFVSALVLMRVAGMQGSVYVGAAINATIGIGALALSCLRSGGYDFSSRIGAGRLEHPPRHDVPANVSFRLGLVIAALGGYVSLSYEIVWFRVFSFASGTSTVAFAAILGAYLSGIAFGAFFARRYCEDTAVAGHRHVRALAAFVLLSNSVGFVLIPAVGYLASLGLGYVFWTLLFITLHGALLGAILPLVSHYAIRPDSLAGRRLSYIYFANIIGSAAGSLITGFVLMDRLSLRETTVLLTLIGLSLGVALLLPAKHTGRGLAARLVGVGVVIAALLGLSPTLYTGFYERLQHKAAYTEEGPFAEVIENKHGVITVDEEGKVFGGGVYDGFFAPLDLVFRRPFLLSAYHPLPRRVLTIGIATGSWAHIFANHPQVERLVAIEINPGYLKLIESRPVVRSLLTHPKAEIVVDDGRRWLNRNPGERFDFIVSNTTLDFRAHATNLLSVEFIELVKRHLAPGGVYLYNALNSGRSMSTACRSFMYGQRVRNVMIVSDSRLDFDVNRLLGVLTRYEIDGTPVVDPRRSADQRRLHSLEMDLGTLGNGADGYVEECESVLARVGHLPVITDDNMGTEWLAPPRGEPLFEYLIEAIKRAGAPDWLTR